MPPGVFSSSRSHGVLNNAPGSFHHLFDITAKKYEADFVLTDLSPGLGSINQNLVMTADYFTVPASPDVFSVMALESLSRVLPRWTTWARGAAQLDALADADYPFPKPHLKFLGTIVQRYRIRKGAPTEAFSHYFSELDHAIGQTLAPSLTKAGLLFPAEKYAAAGVDGYLLTSIPDFNTLIANSQQARKPVFSLTRQDVDQRGRVWDTINTNILAFREIFTQLAHRIEILTDSDA